MSKSNVVLSESAGKSKKQFCEPIEPKEYRKQNESDIEKHLLALLDEIVANENLTVEEKRKQLKKVSGNSIIRWILFTCTCTYHSSFFSTVVKILRYGNYFV